MGGWVWGQKTVCVPKMGLLFLALDSKFHFSLEANFFGFGWAGCLAWGGGYARPPPPPPACHSRRFKGERPIGAATG